MLGADRGLRAETHPAYQHIDGVLRSHLLFGGCCSALTVQRRGGALDCCYRTALVE